MTYLLSDGTYRLMTYASPINYKDEDGNWQPIDTTLVPVPGEESFVTEAAPVEVTLSEEGEGAKPVTLETDGSPVTLNLVGCDEDDMQVEDNAATYSTIALDTDVTYVATGSGVKETLTLASAAAPNSFSYRLSHPGLEMRQDGTGEWGLYAAGGSEAIYRIGTMNACDSSVNEVGEPAWCDGARMVVVPGDGESTLSFSLPRAWLADPARVFPVLVDPEVFTPSSTTDTYISQGNPSTSYGSATGLFAGNITSSDNCKTFVKFNQLGSLSSIPNGRHIVSADFQIRQYWSANTNYNVARIARVIAPDWSGSSTYSGINGSIQYDPLSQIDLGSDATTWLHYSCPGIVANWEDETYANRGFMLYQSSAEGTGYARKFRSAQYSDPDYQPSIEVVYENPQTAITAPSVAKIGDTVSVTVNVSDVSDGTNQMDEIRMGINRASGTPHGVMGWFRSNPSIRYPDTAWTGVRAGNGSWFGFHNHTSYGGQYITPLLSSCAISADRKQATFVFKVNDNWGNYQDNHFDTRLQMLSGSKEWVRDWEVRTSNMDVRPKPLSWLTSTKTATGWYTVVGGTNDTTDQGRGTVNLEWAAAPGATGYAVYMWDGVKYNQVATTTALSWSTGQSRFPTDTQIATLPAGCNPFSSPYATRALRDDPKALYAKMTGAASSDTAYHFKVVPTNSATTQLSPGTSLAGGDVLDYPVTLDKRSLVANEDPQHTSSDLGSWLGHGFAAELDTGSLSARVTDLELSAWGPKAAVSRSYSSEKIVAGAFAPGWFFGFERKLSFPDASHVRFTDAAQHVHEFVGSGASWTAPNGFLAALTQDGSGWRLTFTDQSYLSFDSTGSLTRETDQNGNYVTYVWTNGNLRIRSYLNGGVAGSYIDLVFSGGKIQSASWTETVNGQQMTRRVDYSTASPWTVTTYPGVAGLEKAITYGYSASSRITSVTLDKWPDDDESALATFTYNASEKLTELGYPDKHATTAGHAVIKSDAKATISYDTATQATVRRYGTVAGTAGQELNKTVVTWSAQTGLETSEQVGTTNPATTTYDYAPNLQLAGSTTVDSSDETVEADSSVIEPDGDEAASTVAADSDDSANQTTTYTYDTQHRILSETVVLSPGQSMTTTYTYSGSNVIEEACQLSGAWVSDVQRTFDGYGRKTMEKTLVSGTPTSGTWIETQYPTSSYAPNGEPQTTIAKAVKLSDGGAASDLSKTTSYDAFGNLTSETDWGGRTTATNAYDLAGNQLTTTDAAGVVTHVSYDRMGNPTQTWKTAAGTQVKADWSATTYDPMGRALQVETRLSDSAGNPTVQSTVTNDYDGSGNQISRHDTTVSGDEKWVYDQFGRVTSHWALGAADSTTAARATRTAYDAAGRETGVSGPGNSAAPGSAGSQVTNYDDAGQVTQVTSPDGSWTKHTYDGAGNELATTDSLAASGDYTAVLAAPASTVKTYDVASRLSSAATASSFVTGYARDLAGRETGATGAGQAQTQTRYNTLGWVLWKQDASVDTLSGAMTMVYDAHGSVTHRTVGNQGTTVSVYDAVGRLSTCTDAMGNKVTYTYDAFGRVTGELHEDWTGLDLRNLTSVLDSLGRPTSVSDAVSGRSHTWTYPVNTAATAVRESITYPSGQTSTAVTRNARGVETSRATTIASGVAVTRSIADSTSGRDEADRWKTATIQKTGGTAHSLSRTIDGAGRITAQSGAGFTSAGSYTYDAGTGLKTAESLPLALGGAVSSSYDYTPDRRLATATVGGVAGKYVFDGAGNLSFDTEGATTTSFIYDAANRLTQTSDGTTTTVYGWNTTNGWRVSQGPSAAPTQVQYTYVKSGTSSSNGRMTRYQNSVTGVDASYAYDASGQRVKSSVTQGGVTTATTFTYDGLMLLGLSTTQGSTSWRIDYLYDAEGTPYGGVYRAPASSAPTYFTLITDAHGDVLELLDAGGYAFASYRYDAWGLPRAAGTTTAATTLVNAALAAQIAGRQVLRYAGYAYDAESGLYYCSARYYDPSTRQWTTCDPAKADGELSLFRYCGGNPVQFMDKTGHDSWTSYEIAESRKRLKDAKGRFTAKFTLNGFQKDLIDSDTGEALESWVRATFGKVTISNHTANWRIDWARVEYRQIGRNVGSRSQVVGKARSYIQQCRLPFPWPNDWIQLDRDYMSFIEARNFWLGVVNTDTGDYYTWKTSASILWD